MSGRMAGWSAWGLWAVTVLAVAPTLFLASVNESSSARNTALVALLTLAFSSVGALIASRRPENPIGWLFLSGASLWMLGELALEYAVYALISAPESAPAAAWIGWFGGWARGTGWFLVVMFPVLLFPTGRLPSTRWRPVMWGAVVFVAFFTLVTWLSPDSVDLRLAPIGNPLGLDLGVMRSLGEVVYFGLPLLLLACGASVVVRFRRSRGDERQQIKWFAYAVAMMVLLFASWFLLALTGFVPPDVLLWTIPLLGLPAGVGVAILRHRLYDIDVVINTTLVYGTLTAALAGVYVASVASLQRMLHSFAVQESGLVVVASTLAIAALFNPLRRRIQAFVDRRFYRSKYDATRTLEAFSTRLRDETDLGKLDEDLLATVRRTVQPEHAALWLREPEQGRRVDVTPTAGSPRTGGR